MADMAAYTETLQSNSLPKSITHHGRPVRHVSAPAHPHLTEVCEMYGPMNRIHSSVSPRLSATSSWSTATFQGELSLTQSLVTRLRLERGITTQLQKTQLFANDQENKRQKRAITTLKDEKTALCTKHNKAIKAHNTLLARVQNTLNNHDNLVDQLNGSDRTIARLKKSDRAKGKVWQRNLRLKATLGQLSSQASSTAGQRNEAALLEAFALANERIGELESKGETLLELLEKQDDSCEEDENEDGLNCGVRMVEAKATFRGVLEDETFKEKKEGWGELLEEWE